MALNYYIGKTNVTGYHIINFIIHIITTFFLFKTLILLLSLPKIKLIPSEVKNEINRVENFANKIEKNKAEAQIIINKTEDLIENLEKKLSDKGYK